MWGTAASATQSEGASPASDWWDLERQGKAPDSGDGNGFSSRYSGDFALYAQLGLTHHRLSIDWARIEPEPGRRDPEAVARYRAILEAAADAGITPWVCLLHFTLPRWFSAAGSFLDTDTWRRHWLGHVDFVAETFSDLVGGWQPVNEPNYWPRLAYLGGRLPPGINDLELFGQASEGVHMATAEAALRLRGTARPVCSIYGLSVPVGLDQTPETVRRVDEHLSDHWTSWVGLVREGVLRIRERPPIDAAHLADVYDLIGFSYYRTTGYRSGATVAYPPGSPLSDMGYAVSANGLRLVIDRLSSELPGRSLVVAEYGIGTADDTLRAEYLRDGLEVVHDAIASGTDIRGLFHWTGVDNYEWMRGFDVSFGLIDRDRNVRPSAKILSAEALG